MGKNFIRVLFVSFFVICLALITGGIELIQRNFKGNSSVNVDIKNIGYDSITFEVNNDTKRNLNYLIESNNQLIDQGEVKQEAITISNLREDNEYILKIVNEKKILYNEKLLTKKRVVIRFGGDVMATMAFTNYINQYGVDYIWKDISPLLTKADYSIVNLETSVSNRGKDTKAVGYGFRTNPSALEGFRNAGIDLVNIANNHTLDYGREAFLDTMTHLNNYNIKYSGGGKNINEALTPVYTVINGIKVGFLSADRIAKRTTWTATNTNPGVVSLDKNREQLIASIQQANKECDVLILMLHWGVEYSAAPTNEQVTLAHQFIDQGVDVIIGTHSHILQGVEIYKNKPIYYSIGNFIFLKSTPETGYTALFEMTIDEKGIHDSRFYPVNIKGCKANLLTKDSDLYKTIINTLKKSSEALGTTVDENGYISIDKG